MKKMKSIIHLNKKKYMIHELDTNIGTRKEDLLLLKRDTFSLFN